MSTERDIARPPLSVVITAREGLPEVAPVLEVLAPLAEAAGAEVLVVGGRGPAPSTSSPAVRAIPMPVDDILALRHRGIAEAAGEVIAIGEDHAFPRPDWCEAVIRGHAEHPEAAVVVGCLVNATTSNVSARANFLAFAADWQPPMPVLPRRRPPPASAVSVKRGAVEDIVRRSPGWFEAELLPALFNGGGMVADDRVVVDHHQDHGALWTIRNAFDASRATYGYLHGRLGGAERRRVARWTLDGIPRRALQRAGAPTSSESVGTLESALVTTIAVCSGLGGALGTLFGPGRSADRVA